MSKEQIIDEAYQNYLKNGQQQADRNKENQTFLPLPKNWFINKCKTDPEFSETWGLKIEERELSVRERLKLVGCKDDVVIESVINSRGEEFHKNKMDKQNIPTKLITLTYDNETIESYD